MGLPYAVKAARTVATGGGWRDGPFGTALCPYPLYFIIYSIVRPYISNAKSTLQRRSTWRNVRLQIANAMTTLA
jgi:hypothetical protein